MRRYRSQAVHAALSSDFQREDKVVLSASTSPMMRGEDLMVWEPEQSWVLNGLLDADGRPMERVVANQPIGFLARHD
jgi:hypothetical protein